MADANIKAVITAEDKASSTLKSFGDNASLSFTKMAGAVAAGQFALQAIEKTATDVVGVFKDSIDAATQLGKQTLSLERTFGLTAEQGSSLLAIFERFGIDADNASKSLGIFETKMLQAKDGTSTGGDILKQYGIKAVGATGNLRNMNDVLLDVADAFKYSIPITERAADARELFGRAGQSLIPALIQGRDGIKALTEEAKREGVVLSQDNVNAVLANARAHARLDEAIKGAQTQIGLALIPIITNLINKILDWINANGGVEKIMQEKVIPVIKEVIAWVENNKQSFLDIIQAVIDFGKVIGFVFDAAGKVFSFFHNTVAGGIYDIIYFFQTLPARLSGALVGLADLLVAPFRTAFNAIISLWNDSIGKIAHGQTINAGPVHLTLPNLNVPKLAEGGIVTKPTLAMIGEAGPEAVVPLNKAAAVNININVGTYAGSQMELRKLANTIMSAYQDAKGMGTI